MKVGDWVLVTPDDYDKGVRKMSAEPTLARIVRVTPRGREVWVKLLFHAESEKGWQMFTSQCQVIVEAPNVSQSDPT